MDGEDGNEAQIGRRLGISRKRERQRASDLRYEFPRSFARIGGAMVLLWPEDVWRTERRAVGSPTCQG